MAEANPDVPCGHRGSIGLYPLRPLQPRPRVVGVSQVKQCVVAKVTDLVQRSPPPAQQSGAADGEDFFLAQKRHVALCALVAAAVPDDQIDCPQLWVNQSVIGLDVEVEIGTVGTQPGEARHQPQGGKRCRGRHLDATCDLRLAQTLNGVGQSRQGFADNFKQDAPLFGELQSAMPPFEQHLAQIVFELLHLTTDGRLGHEHLLAGL